MDPPDAGRPHSHTPTTHTYPYPFPTPFSRHGQRPFTSYIAPPFPLPGSPKVVVSPPVPISPKSPTTESQPPSKRPEDSEVLIFPKSHVTDPQPQPEEYEGSEGSENLYMIIARSPALPSSPTTPPTTPPRSRDDDIDEWVAAVAAATAHENCQRNRRGEALRSSLNTLRFPQRSPPPPPSLGGAKKVGLGVTMGLRGGGADDKSQSQLKPNGVSPPDPYPNPGSPPRPPATNGAKKSGSGPSMVLRRVGNDDGAPPRPPRPEYNPDRGQSIFKLVNTLIKLSELLESYEKFHGQVEGEPSVHPHMAYWDHIEVAVRNVGDEYDRVSFMRREGQTHAPEAGVLEKTATEIVEIWRLAYAPYEQAMNELPEKSNQKLKEKMVKVAEHLRVELDWVGAEREVEKISGGIHGKKVPRNPRYE